MSDYIPIKGCIYLLKLCDTNQRIIYKVGKSINFYKRFSKYNYAEILMFITSDDITQDENEIINIFNINCKLDKGREFFLAKDDCFVLNLFINYFNTKNNRNMITSNIVVNTDNRIIEIENSINTIENISIDNMVIEHIENATDNNTNIVDYVCPNINCNKKFNYCSYLKKHLLNSYHCNKSIDNINLYFIEIDKIKKNNVITPLDI